MARQKRYRGNEYTRNNCWTCSIKEKQAITSSQNFLFLYKEHLTVDLFHSRVEAGSNTSTITLRVVGGDEKGSLRWRRPGAIVNDRPVLSSDRAPHINKPATDSNKNLVVSPRRVLYSKIDWRLTVGRNV
jgi:hypothetical protein